LLSAVISSSILIGGSFVIIFQVLPILLNSEEVNAFGMLGRAVIALIFNRAGFFLVKKGESLIANVLFWHFLEYVLVWVGILVGALIIYVIDLILTSGSTGLILYNVNKKLREAINILMQGVPKKINLDNVKKTCYQ
jgi:cobalt-zinc-cadmium efflux system protein